MVLYVMQKVVALIYCSMRTFRYKIIKNKHYKLHDCLERNPAKAILKCITLRYS